MLSLTPLTINLENSSDPGKLTASGQLLTVGGQRGPQAVSGRDGSEALALIGCHALGRLTVVGSGADTLYPWATRVC